jgi:hypothetical protein
VSYRSSSYRKVSRIVRKTISTASGDSAQLLRFEMDRVLHWSQQPALPKPRAWGKPKAGR